ncbi:MAG: hypothetical protein RLY14_1041 [Planctomycetota bacterium]|jgi:hypothetical protein
MRSSIFPKTLGHSDLQPTETLVPLTIHRDVKFLKSRQYEQNFLSNPK